MGNFVWRGMDVLFKKRRNVNVPSHHNNHLLLYSYQRTYVHFSIFFKGWKWTFHNSNLIIPSCLSGSDFYFFFSFCALTLCGLLSCSLSSQAEYSIDVTSIYLNRYVGYYYEFAKAKGTRRILLAYMQKSEAKAKLNICIVAALWVATIDPVFLLHVTLLCSECDG